MRSQHTNETTRESLGVTDAVNVTHIAVSCLRQFVSKLIATIDDEIEKSEVSSIVDWTQNLLMLRSAYEPLEFIVDRFSNDGNLRNDSDFSAVHSQSHAQYIKWVVEEAIRASRNRENSPAVRLDDAKKRLEEVVSVLDVWTRLLSSSSNQSCSSSSDDELRRAQSNASLYLRRLNNYPKVAYDQIDCAVSEISISLRSKDSSESSLCMKSRFLDISSDFLLCSLILSGDQNDKQKLREHLKQAVDLQSKVLERVKDDRYCKAIRGRIFRANEYLETLCSEHGMLALLRKSISAGELVTAS